VVPCPANSSRKSIASISAAELWSLLFDAHEFSDQAFAATRCQTLVAYSVASRRDRDHTQEADGARDARQTLCASGELWPVGTRQTKKLADHRQRQLSRLLLRHLGHGDGLICLFLRPMGPTPVVRRSYFNQRGIIPQCYTISTASSSHFGLPARA
jgi:hypothetical protein